MNPRRSGTFEKKWAEFVEKKIMAPKVLSVRRTVNLRNCFVCGKI